MPSNSSLSAVADDRKARLASLRNLKRKQPADETVPPESTRSPSPPGEKNQPQPLRISGRNYDVEARGPKLGFESGPNEGLDKPTLEEQAAQIEEESRRRAEEEAKDDKGIDLFKLQPKKPNWDLKRDLDKKMKILNVRTDNAIARLVRERIAEAQKAKQKSEQDTPAQADGESTGMDGVALVEGLRMREKEEEEEERREREEEKEMDS